MPNEKERASGSVDGMTSGVASLSSTVWRVRPSTISKKRRHDRAAGIGGIRGRIEPERVGSNGHAAPRAAAKGVGLAQIEVCRSAGSQGELRRDVHSARIAEQPSAGVAKAEANPADLTWIWTSPAHRDDIQPGGLEMGEPRHAKGDLNGPWGYRDLVLGERRRRRREGQERCEQAGGHDARSIGYD